MARSKSKKKTSRILRDSVLSAVNCTVFHIARKSIIINEREIRFIGLQRSGNHALINWIFNQCQGKKCLLNWVVPDSNPFYSFHRKSTIKEFQADFYKNFNLTLEKSGFFSKKELLIYSYEDDALGNIATDKFDRNHDRWIGKSGVRYDLLLMRDPFNLIASRLKRDDTDVENRYSFRIEKERKILIELWKQYAREFLCITNHLAYNKICVNYNKWFVDKTYRVEIADKLNIEFNDKGMEEVTQIGGGSSFDSIDYNRKASEMKVLERWKHYKDDKDFQLIFKDQELMELSGRIFGQIPGVI